MAKEVEQLVKEANRLHEKTKRLKEALQSAEAEVKEAETAVARARHGASYRVFNGTDKLNETRLEISMIDYSADKLRVEAFSATERIIVDLTKKNAERLYGSIKQLLKEGA
ncbi:hypothetical protein GC174_14840 [bacterium]|nr:hypothetical protein [bacterium]